jgi:hypothetical protein
MLALLQQQLLLGGKKEKKQEGKLLHTTHDSPCPNNFSSLLLRFARKGMARRSGGSLQEPKHKQRSSSCCYFCTVGKERNPQTCASTSASEGGYPRPLLSSQGGKKKMETTTDLVEENRKQGIIHRSFYTIYLFLFEAGWVGWLVWSCFGIRRTRSRGNQLFLAETKIEAKIGGAIL